MKDDLAIFERMRNDDRSAFRTLFDDYVDRLYTYAFGFMKNREASEDMVQEVFISIWENRASINLTQSVYSYLLKAVRNNCINRLLREKVEKRYVDYIAANEAGDADMSDFDEMYRNAMAIVDTLPRRCREIFLMGCAEGMSYKEISEQLDVSQNTVKTQMKIAFKRLREYSHIFIIMP